MKSTLIEVLRYVHRLVNSGDFKKAKALCLQVLRDEPRNTDALNLAGIIAMNNGAYDEAIQAFEKVLEVQPERAPSYYNLGLACIKTGQWGLAASYLQTAVQLKPGLEVAYADLCLALTRSGKVEAALEAGKNAVLLLPENPVAHYNLSLAYSALKAYELSFKHCLKAAQLLPEHPSIQIDLAGDYVGLGDIAAAVKCLRKAIRLNPRDVEPYRQLARITKYSSPDHEDVYRIKKLASEDWLTESDHASVLFALGKIYQDCSLYDDAFGCYEQGNRLQEKLNPFDPEEFERYISSIIGMSTQATIAGKSVFGNPSETPVLIVGTPRSGTSLVEQILASHPEVFGAGELDWFVRTAETLPGYLNTSGAYPECIPALGKESIADLSSRYLGYISSLAADERRITDKMPGNFLYLNLMHIFFPRARIIHCRRDPMDACLSMYTEYFPGAVPYSCNLTKLGAYYRQYERIMEHWHSVLPPSVMIDIDYEALVLDQEVESRRLVEFIGLEWDEVCLAFYEKKRYVRTASDLQVKKPIYTSSIGRWKNYQKHLRPLEKELKRRYCPS